MVKYICDICGKIFKQKSHYTQHQKRKTPCTNNIKVLKQVLNEISPLSDIDNSIGDNTFDISGKKCNVNFQTQYVYFNEEKCIHIDKYIKKTEKPHV